jgi:hypothetical protein
LPAVFSFHGTHQSLYVSKGSMMRLWPHEILPNPLT